MLPTCIVSTSTLLAACIISPPVDASSVATAGGEVAVGCHWRPLLLLCSATSSSPSLLLSLPPPLICRALQLPRPRRHDSPCCCPRLCCALQTPLLHIFRSYLTPLLSGGIYTHCCCRYVRIPSCALPCCTGPPLRSPNYHSRISPDSITVEII